MKSEQKNKTVQKGGAPERFAEQRKANLQANARAAQDNADELNRTHRAEEMQALLDEESKESFPASDPPSHTGAHS